MIDDSNEFFLDLWSRVKPFIPSKERFDAAEAFLMGFEDHNMITGLDSLNSEELDKEMKKAVTAKIEDENEFLDDDELDIFGDEDDYWR